MAYGLHTELTKPREVLAIDASHPDEKRAGMLYESLVANPIPHVTAIIGNLAAYSMPAGANGGVRVRRANAGLGLGRV